MLTLTATERQAERERRRTRTLRERVQAARRAEAARESATTFALPVRFSTSCKPDCEQCQYIAWAD